MAAAIPWKSIKIPKALVSFSKPRKSTTIIERRAEKQATGKNKVLV